MSTPTHLTSLSLQRLPRNQLLPAVSTPTGGVYSYRLYLILHAWPHSAYTVYSETSPYLLCLLLPAVSSPTSLSLCLPAWPPSVYPGTSFYLLSLLLPAVSTPTCLASLSLHSLPKNQLLPAVSIPTCCVYFYLTGLTKSTQSTQEPVSTCCVYSYLLCLILPAVSTPICLASLSLHNLFRIKLDILPPVHCPAHPLSYRHHHKLGIPHTAGHPVVRDDGKLGGLGHATLGRSIVLPCGSPSPPLLHEDKLSGHGSGGPEVVRLRQEGKLALQHEVKLLGPVAGGLSVVRLRQEGKLVLQHEVKLFGQVYGGGADLKLASPQANQTPDDPAPPVLQPCGPSANYQVEVVFNCSESK